MPRVILLGLGLGAGFGACEHPLPPANPTPLVTAAQQLDVPVSVLAELRQTADRLARSAPPNSTTPPDPASAEAQLLRETLRRLEENYRGSQPATP